MANVPPPRDPNAPKVHEAEVEGTRDPSLPRYGWFAGVLEGRLGDPDALRAAAEMIQGLGLADCDLEIDGGRFSLLFDEEPVPGARLTVENQDALIQGLQAIVQAAASTATIESTLRGSLIFKTSVVETLFKAKDGQLDLVSRRRDLEERDRAHAPSQTPKGALGGLDASVTGIDARRGIALLLLVLVGGSLFAWNRGYFELLGETFFARNVDEMPTGPGPFGDALELSVERSFGKYVCTVRRGLGYPTTPEAVAALIDAAESAEARAAANAVGNGGVIGVALLDEKRNVLDSAELRLSSLLKGEDAHVEAKLRARLGGRILELVLDADAGGEKGDDSGRR